ncbi:MAG: uridine kinase [Bacilli bacterium]
MPRIILVGGGSSSGKTYVTENVIKNIGEENVTRLTIDDYYRDQSDMPITERVKVNYDHPKAFDWPLMRNQIRDLKDGKAIQKPIYDFTIHNRAKDTELIVPKKLIVVEGIMALVDKKLCDMGDLRVFISASRERRLLRRMIRDHEERKRSFDNIVNQYFNTVQPMFEEIIAPSSNYADVIVNNDGVENLAIDVLTCVFREELEKASLGLTQDRSTSSEFTEEKLAKVFLDGDKEPIK